MSVVKIDWTPDKAGYRKFGIAVFVGFTIIGALVWLFGGSLSATRETGRFVWGSLPWFTLIPAAVLLLSLTAPKACRPLYLVWMGFAFVMGTVVSTVLLAIIYWVVFGGIATIFRLRRRDRMALREPARGFSGWSEIAAAPAREQYQRQF
jgi:hypothetical protein